MNKQYLTLTAIGLLVLFSHNSCINKNYDWDNLNKEITFEIGNVPLGNVSPIRIDSLLESNIESDIKFSYDNDGYVALKYEGKVDIDIPSFTMGEVVSRRTKKMHVITPDLLNGLPKGSYEVATGENIEYKLDEPNQGNDDDWEVDIKEVVFNSADIYVELILKGIEFPEDSVYTIDVEMLFPKAVSLAGSDDRKVVFTVDASEFNEDGNCWYGPISMESFAYTTDEDIKYSVTLYRNGDEDVIATAEAGEENHRFYMFVHTENLDPSLVYADAKFNKRVEGEVNDLDALGEIFKDGDFFELNRSQMDFKITTNLGFNLNMFVDELNAEGGDKKIYLPDLTGTTGMKFEAPDKFESATTEYHIVSYETNDNQFSFYQPGLNELINTKPQYLSYAITAATDDWQKDGFFVYNDSRLDTEYTFNIPFDFKRIQVSVDEMMEDVFSEDIADKLFNNEGNFIIAADEVIVQLGGANASGNVKVMIDVTVYDYNNEPVLDSNTATLQNGTNKLEITIPVTKKDIPQMKNAKHLGFNFRIEGSDMKLNKSDHITINKLKFKTDAGISWEL